MYKKTYKDTKDEISVLGLGCMRLPKISPDKEDIDYKKAEEIVDYAYAHGINYFDTAYPYHGGKSEVFVGDVLCTKYKRDTFFLASKMPGWEVKDMSDVERIFDEQLKKCKTDYFDFYLCHALSNEAFKIYEKVDIIGFLDKKKKEGKIKRLGFSFHDTPEVLERLIKVYDWDFVQLQINYLDWEMQNAKRLYEITVENNVPCVVMEPVRGGSLANLSADAAAILKEKRPDMSVASWAIRFVASLPNVMCVLSGMTTIDQIIDNVNTMTDFEHLSDDEREVLDRALKKFKENTLIPCTGCRYCIECPQTVDIPAIFKLYNEYSLSKWDQGFLNGYKEIEDSRKAHNCVECGQCMTHCPQGIKITEKLKEVNETYNRIKNK